MCIVTGDGPFLVEVLSRSDFCLLGHQCGLGL